MKVSSHLFSLMLVVISVLISQLAFAEKEMLCEGANSDCSAFIDKKSVSRGKDEDRLAIILLKTDLIESVLSKKDGLFPLKYRDELAGENKTKLENIARTSWNEMIHIQYELNLQDQKYCFQMSEKPFLVLQEMRFTRGPELYEDAVKDIKNTELTKTSSYKEKYAYKGSFICEISDKKIKEKELETYAKKRGMRGYVRGLEQLVSQARLPINDVGYLFYATGEDGYIVTQSFGNKILAASIDYRTPVIVDFGKSSALSEGSALRGLYLHLVSIGPYKTALGVERNAFFFKAVDAPKIQGLRIN